jgi:hypothetical protein
MAYHRAAIAREDSPIHIPASAPTAGAAIGRPKPFFGALVL